MADKPILFSPPMVLALLEGRKTQTRRILDLACDEPPAFVRDGVVTAYDENDVAYRWPRTPAVGDRLWVREVHYRFGHWEPIAGKKTKGGRQKWGFVADTGEVLFDAPAEHRKGRRHKDPATPAWHKRLARFMPRAMSRMTLGVTEVRVEALQAINEADCLAEGAPKERRMMHGLGAPLDGIMVAEPGRPHLAMTPRNWYRGLWDTINGTGAWDANPWVFATTFTVERRNIDA